MNSRTLCVALLLSSLPAAGCGTVANLARPGPEVGVKIPFGGVKHDIDSVHAASNHNAVSDPQPQMEQCKQVAKAVFCAIDLPFSLIGDTVMYPYVRAYNFINSPTLTTPPLQVAPPTVVQVTAEGMPQNYPQALPQQGPVAGKTAGPPEGSGMPQILPPTNKP